ncbi:MAG: hypothetical protein ACUVV1_01845 [Fimbriimonadales bacterium]
MALKQQQATESGTAQVYYSPEEAGEILRLAANLQDNVLTVDQLRAIAREAGVSDENLERAIEQFQRRRTPNAQPVQRRTKRSGWLRAMLKLGVAVLIMFCALFAFLYIVEGDRVSRFPAYVYSQWGKELLLTSSSSFAIYKAEVTEKGRTREVVVVRHRYGHEFVVGRSFQNITEAFIAPFGEHAALYDAGTGEIYIVSTTGNGLQFVGRSGEALTLPSQAKGVIARENPIIGWKFLGSDNMLQIRLEDGRTADIRVSEFGIANSAL